MDLKNARLIEKFRGKLMKRGRDAGNTAFSCLVSRLAVCDPEVKRIPLLLRPQTSPRHHHYLVGGGKQHSYFSAPLSSVTKQVESITLGQKMPSERGNVIPLQPMASALTQEAPAVIYTKQHKRRVSALSRTYRSAVVFPKVQSLIGFHPFSAFVRRRVTNHSGMSS